MFDANALEAIIQKYQLQIEAIRKSEVYKWEAAHCFQQHWNPNAQDFASMIASCVAKSGNLLTGAVWYAAGMLKVFAANFPEELRLMMLSLFDEQQPLRQRLENFEKQSISLLEQENAKRAESGNQLAMGHFQDTRSMSVYLAFVNPLQNYIYKSGMYKKFAKEVGASVPGNKFDKVIEYKKLCNDILEYLEENHPKLIERSDSLLAPEYVEADPGHHILVQDIIYFVDAYMKDEEPPVIEQLTSDGEAGDTGEEGKNYWFLVANPKMWTFASVAPGEEDFYTLYNEKGNPRRILKHFLAAKPGDMIIGYESQPIKKTVALCEVTREHDEEKMYFKKVCDIAVPVTYEQMHNDELLSKMEFMRNYSGSLFTLSKEEFDVLMELSELSVPPVEIAPESYTDEDFLSQVFMDASSLAELKSLLKRKRNIILQGAPGTGKTFAAKRLAWSIMGCKDSSRVQQVQFHQSTTYDDFVYGYRPNSDGGFEPTPGVFVEFCRKASLRPHEDFFFIIDEINRANISKVFGELLMLIEADHRDESVVLPVSGEQFDVPSNVYIIGMMNTADRGLALIDYALRRRFAFFEMQPALKNERFEKQAALSGEKMSSLVYAVIKLNERIESETSLGRGFRIGHSYFCPDADGNPVDPASVVKYELAPLVEEYWFDDEKRAREEIDKLKAASQ